MIWFLALLAIVILVELPVIIKQAGKTELICFLGIAVITAVYALLLIFNVNFKSPIDALHVFYSETLGLNYETIKEGLEQ